MGCLRLYFLLPSGTDSGELILRVFEYTYLYENLTIFEIAFRSIGTRISRLMKKRESKISLDCPFTKCSFETLANLGGN
jgi:hypothetical protein